MRAATAKYNLWEGAVASGKTIGSLYRWLLFVKNVEDLPGALVMAGRTRDAVWRNAIMPMMDLFPGVMVGNLGAPTCRILGNLIHIIGASDVKAEAVIRGMTAKGFYIDELTTLPESFFKMALTRLRVAGRSGGVASRLFATTNPDGPNHWLMRDYLAKMATDPEMARDWCRFKFSIDDNSTLPAEFVRSMHAQYTGLWYKRFILGEWVNAEGAIWSSWASERHVVEPHAIPPMEHVLGIGLDFGTEHRTAAILIGYADRRLWALDEWAPPKGLAPSQYSALFRGWIATQPVADWVFIDPAAKHFRQQLFLDGVSNIAPAANRVTDGLLVISSLLATDRLVISSKCSNLIGEIPGYVWDPKATDRGEEAPMKANDDFCDALRYAVQSTAPMWRTSIPILAAQAVEKAA